MPKAQSVWDFGIGKNKGGVMMKEKFAYLNGCGADFLLNTNEVSAVLNVDIHTVGKIANNSELPYVIIGKKRLFRVSDLNKYIKGLGATGNG